MYVLVIISICIMYIFLIIINGILLIEKKIIGKIKFAYENFLLVIEFTMNSPIYYTILIIVGKKLVSTIYDNLEFLLSTNIFINKFHR